MEIIQKQIIQNTGWFIDSLQQYIEIRDKD